MCANVCRAHQRAATTQVDILKNLETMSRCIAVRCSVLQRVAACCSVLQWVAACCSVLLRVAAWCCVLQYVAVCCSVFQHLIEVNILKYRLATQCTVDNDYTCNF